jgi:hypothetical protein
VEKKREPAAKKPVAAEAKTPKKAPASTVGKATESVTKTVKERQKSAAKQAVEAKTKATATSPESAKKAAAAPQTSKKAAAATSAAAAQAPDKPVTKAAKPRAGTEGVSVSRAAVCTDVVEHEPRGSATTFGGDVGKLYCFTHVKGVRDTLVVKHNWYHNGTLVGATTLPVRSSSWRTYSARRLGEKPAGAWKVEVVNTETGDPLETVEFTVQ